MEDREQDKARPEGSVSEIKKPRGWLESLNCAIEGIIYAFKTQRHIRYQFVLAVVVLGLSLFLNLPIVEFMLFVFAILILLFAEMFNTALEEIVNLVEEKGHDVARNAKDVSAGAVLIASIGLAFMSYLIFTRYLVEPFGMVLDRVRAFSGHIAVIALLLVLISVVAAKAVSSRVNARPLHGGMPSGHAAVAFSLSTSISLLTLNPLVAVLCFALALMVSQSRLVGRIHTWVEVALGALLGAGLTLLVFWLFTRVL